MTEWSHYTDSRIDPARQIRVLELRPGCGHQPLSGYLRVRDPKCSGYEALSYTWGGSAGSKSVILNDRAGLAVTDNLFNALQRMRRCNTARILWIDAICINQADLQERSRQVQLMGAIYRNATNVLIWLGDADEPVETEHSPFQPPQDMIPRNGKFITRPSDAMDRIMRSHDAAISSTTPRWWTRTWIIQEVVLAKNPVVCFGEFELTWSDVGNMREDMSVLMETTLSTIEPEAKANMMEDEILISRSPDLYIKRYRATDFDDGYQVLNDLRIHNNTRAGLSDLASTTAHSVATDPRDRVFGYFGLWSGSGSGMLSINYEKATAEVFAEATFADMRTEGNLEVLDLVRPHHAHQRGLPTWALDFSFQDCDSYLPVIPKAVRRADGNVLRGIPSLSQNSRYLTLDVIVIDQVKSTHPLPKSLLYPEPAETEYLAEIMSHIPVANVYVHLQDRLSSAGTAADSQNDGQSKVEYQRMPDKTALAEQLNVQTDPVSDIFLWWITKVTERIPAKTEFSELYEWWRTYARYQFSSKGSKSGGNPSLFYHSTSGFIGKALHIVRAGDLIVLLDGLELPAIIRPTGENHLFVGLTWLNGAMMGEMAGPISVAAGHVGELHQRITLL